MSATALQRELGPALVALLSPEHGWSGLFAEGEAISHGYEPSLKLPVISLYGKSNNWQSTLEDLDVDTIIIDLQDIGVRCYTYGLTCADLIDNMNPSVEFMVCDRPNPLGSLVKGPTLEKELKSFVGHFEIPFQHGQTLGQILKTYHQKMTVIECDPYLKPFEFPWIPPSPNLPSWEAMLLYPGLVFLEGTNVSEGRGTTLPFTTLGAPGLDAVRLVNFINDKGKNSLKAHPIYFTPHSGKLKNKDCQGAHILITHPERLDSYEFGLDLLKYLKNNYTEFKWEPEINSDTYFIDYLFGTKEIRKNL
jgi:uncharacterized protein YbbC (DUF1343 family)